MENKTDSRKKIYVDMDDVILNTSEVVIDYLNKKYDINPPKTIMDLKDWKYSSIYRNMNSEEVVSSIFDSDEFFEKIKINEDFLRYYNATKERFHWVIFTQGTEMNIEKKRELCAREFPGIEMIIVPNGVKKNTYKLNGWLQIDDVYDNLLTDNVDYKILVTGFKETDYNQILGNHENMYKAYDWKEIIEFIEFMDKSMYEI